MERLYGRMSIGKVHNNVVKRFSHPLVQKAFIVASEGFKDKARKMPEAWPEACEPEGYFSHVFEVAFFLAAYGYPVEVIAAALLHDHIEDLPNWTKTRVAEEFGEIVAELVALVSQPKEGTWLERRNAYRLQLENATGDIQKWALAISCADKICNMRASADKARAGFTPKDYLSQDWRANLEVWRKLGELFRFKVHPLLVKEFDQQLHRWEQDGLQLDGENAHA